MMVRLQALSKSSDSCLLTVTGQFGQTLSIFCVLTVPGSSDRLGVLSEDPGS